MSVCVSRHTLGVRSAVAHPCECEPGARMAAHFTINAPHRAVVEAAENRHDGEYVSSLDGFTTYVSALTGTTFRFFPGANDRTTDVEIPYGQPAYAPLEAGLFGWALAAALGTDLRSKFAVARPDPGTRSVLATDETMRAFVDPIAADWREQNEANSVVRLPTNGGLTLPEEALHAWWMYTYRLGEVNGWLEQAGANIVASGVFLFVDGSAPPQVTRAAVWNPGVATIFPDGAIDAVVVTQTNHPLRIVRWSDLCDVLAPFLQTVEAAFDDGSVELLALTVERSALAFAAYERAGLNVLAGPTARAKPGTVSSTR